MAEPEKVKVSDATRRWRELLDGVAEGKRYHITRDGKAVAMLGPVIVDRQPVANARRYNDAVVADILRKAFPGKKRG